MYTKEQMANLISKVLDCKSELTIEEDEVWCVLEASKPAANTIVITTKERQQFILQIKDVSK